MTVLINAFHQTERNFFSAISFIENIYDNLIAYASGVEASGLNPAIIHTTNKANFTKDLINTQAFYIQQQLPWALLVPDYLQDNSAELIAEQNIHLVDEGVAMVCPLNNWRAPSSESTLNIQEMNQDLSAWSIPIIYGFESTPEKMSTYTQRHFETLGKIEIYHFSGFIVDKAVCSLTVSLLGTQYARLDDVATIPAYQGRGYATELIQFTLNFLKKKQIETCFLEASTSGLSIYRKIGFKELFKNYYYEAQK